MKKSFFSLLFLTISITACSFAEAGGAFYDYDANGRLIWCTYTNQSVIGYTYDQVGNITSVSSFTMGTFTDSDNDGMDDNWERFYFDNLTTADEKTDFDKDGYTDLEEYLLWKEGTMDAEGYPYNPLTYNKGEKNPTGISLLLMIVPVISASQNK